ncbi:MAG: hypothetical protein E7568_05115 [Ruminococcaceae bacterium]|nr:hypothetical protein [Oscillospiraceae bacterium]
MKYIENIANRVRIAEQRGAVIYAKPDGKLYKWIRALYIIFALFSALTSALYCFGRFSRIAEIKRLSLEILSDNDIEKAKTSAITIGIFAAVLIVTTIVLRFRAEIVSAVLTLISATVSIPVLITASQNTAEFNEGINASFWLRHFAPLLLALFFICWLTVIRIRADMIFRRSYLNMVNRIYENYNGEDLTEEEWETFLKDYNPKAEEEKRRRLKKGQPDTYDSIIKKDD